MYSTLSADTCADVVHVPLLGKQDQMRMLFAHRPIMTIGVIADGLIFAGAWFVSQGPTWPSHGKVIKDDRSSAVRHNVQIDWMQSDDSLFFLVLKAI